MVDDLAAVWKALADPTRRRLLDRLKDGPGAVELSERGPHPADLRGLDQRVRRVLGHVAPPAEAPGGGTGQHGEEERETMTGEAQAARAVGGMHVEQGGPT